MAINKKKIPNITNDEINKKMSDVKEENKDKELTKQEAFVKLMEKVLTMTGAKNPKNITVIYEDEDSKGNHIPVFAFTLDDPKSLMYNIEVLKNLILRKVFVVSVGKEGEGNVKSEQE